MIWFLSTSSRPSTTPSLRMENTTCSSRHWWVNQSSSSWMKRRKARRDSWLSGKRQRSNHSSIRLIMQNLQIRCNNWLRYHRLCWAVLPRNPHFWTFCGKRVTSYKNRTKKFAVFTTSTQKSSNPPSNRNITNRFNCGHYLPSTVSPRRRTWSSLSRSRPSTLISQLLKPKSIWGKSRRLKFIMGGTGMELWSTIFTWHIRRSTLFHS